MKRDDGIGWVGYVAWCAFAWALILCWCCCGPGRAEEPCPFKCKAKAALALSFAGPAEVAADTPPAPAPGGPKGYAQCRAEALAKGKVLVAFVGQPAREAPGAVVCSVGSLEGVEAPAVVVGAPRDGKLVWSATLPGKPDRQAVRSAVAKAANPWCCCTTCACPQCDCAPGPAAVLGVPAPAAAPTFPPSYFGPGCAGGVCLPGR